MFPQAFLEAFEEAALLKAECTVRLLFLPREAQQVLDSQVKSTLFV